MDVSLTAARDILQAGSDVSAMRDVAYSAGRNITVTAANERDTASRESSLSRSGLTVTANHNIGSTLDAVRGAGQGEDAVSKVSSTLAAVDAVDQFTRGPTLEASLGNAKSSSKSSVTTDSGRGSTVDAGRDFTAVAGDTLQVNGSRVGAGRDINLSGRDISLGVANGQIAQTGAQTQSSAGLNAGTTNGVKLGVGTSQGVANQTGTQQTSLASSLDAGRDINAQAKNDLTLVGTQANAGRDIQLQAGNDLTIKAAQNAYASRDTRHSSGNEIGLTAGRSGVGVYASANAGRGTLTRDGTQAQVASVNAGNQLALISGRDTTVAGAVLHGDSVNANVGRDLTVTSVPDTGKANGKQTDVSGTVTAGPLPGLSGSLGYGRTNGKTNWVAEQTAITAANQLNLQVGEHTQLNGALINSSTGKLHLDTQTLGFADISGLNKEHSYYLNVGGSFGAGGAQDASQTGKGAPGVNGWSVQGYNANTNREQRVRATVGAGDVVVRGDAGTGTDSTAGLNRDPSKAYEITRDEQHRTEVYASSSSIDAVTSPFETADRWKNQLENYKGNAETALAQGAEIVKGTARVAERAWSEIQAQQVDIKSVPAASRAALGDAAALDIAKNLVRNGLTPDDLSKLSAQDMQLLGGVKELFGSFDPEAATCEGMKGCGAGRTSERTDVYTFTGANGERQNLVLKDETPTTPGQLLLFKMRNVGAYITALKEAAPEQAQLLLIGVQAMMGPAKAAVGLAGNAVIAALLGDQITAAKDKISLSIAAGLSGKDAELIAASNKTVDQVHKEGFIDQAGDVYLDGAKTLLDIALGSTAAIAGAGIAKAAGRPITTSPEIAKALPEIPYKAPLPAGYKEVASVGAQVATPVALPAGYRMVHNTRNGKYEILGSDGVIYVERNGVLKPKAGGNLAELAAAEREIAAGGAKEAGAPKVTIKDHYDHHLSMVDDIKDQLLSQGFRVSEKEISFGSSCGAGRCRPDIVAEAPDGTLRIIEVKTGNADLSIRQSEIFPQIKDGDSIPRGKVAESFGLKSGVPLKEQGYPNGIPIEIMNFPGAKQ
jgi:filamentous hemagglutinin